MEPAPGAGTFNASSSAYDSFMGRYSRPLAVLFADSVGIVRGASALDVGCGPGALTGVLVDRLGADAVSAFDPSLPFVAECTAAYPGVDVRAGRAEAIPFDDDRFDIALAQLVLHFVSDPMVAGVELRRVVRPGGIVGACVWDFEGGMEMLRLFWDAAVDADSAAPDEARTMRFGRDGEIADWLGDAGLDEVAETKLVVTSMYTGFDELWSGFLAGVGPAGSYCVSLPADQQEAVRQGMFDRLGAPDGELILTATAQSAHGHVPG